MSISATLPKTASERSTSALPLYICLMLAKLEATPIQTLNVPIHTHTKTHVVQGHVGVHLPFSVSCTITVYNTILFFWFVYLGLFLLFYTNPGQLNAEKFQSGMFVRYCVLYVSRANEKMRINCLRMTDRVETFLFGKRLPLHQNKYIIPKSIFPFNPIPYAFPRPVLYQFQACLRMYTIRKMSINAYGCDLMWPLFTREPPHWKDLRWGIYIDI